MYLRLLLKDIIPLSPILSSIYKNNILYKINDSKYKRCEKLLHKYINPLSSILLPNIN